MSDIAVGIIGYGLAGRLFHAPFIACTPGLVLRAVVTRAPERVADLAQDHPGVRAVATVEELLQTGVDLVVVASPSGLHAAHVQQALTAGRHVVVDKPAAATAEEFEALVDLALRCDRALVVFHNRRWDSDFGTLRAVLASGDLGTVHRFESRMERWRPAGKGGWRESPDPAALGGLRYDLGPHLVDQALLAFGPVESVWARSRSLRSVGSHDDDVLAALVHESGVTSLLSASLLTAAPGARFRVDGTAGSARLTHADSQEDRLRGGGRPGPGGAGWGHEPDRWAEVITGDPPQTRRLPYLDGQWPAFYDGVRQCIAEGAPAPVSHESALATMRVLDAIGAAARSGGTVPMKGSPS